MTESIIARVARTTVERAAPEELLFFDAAAAAYASRSGRATPRRGRRGDEALGYGVSEVVDLVTPVALTVAGAVVAHLADRVGAAASARTGRLVERLGSRLRRRPPAPTRLPELSAEQLDVIRALAEERARALGLAEDRIALFVDAFMVSVQRHSGEASPDEIAES
ncbi:hypothetical protein [Actinoplanes solisilvae]|uniref:hypothetical protein n=1 Tax=Actinoplanes solisilvae TaxID=2486853 RepID=UPI000FDB0EFB|nr:hypothetical protein [Actinoplanes solisilvae]